MNAADRLRRAANIVEILSELNDDTRGAYLDALGGDDLELRSLVEQVLRNPGAAPAGPQSGPDQPGTSLGGKPELRTGGEGTEKIDSAKEDAGQGHGGRKGAAKGRPSDEHFGPYRAIKWLGTGGMGAVYLAEREDDEFQRLVAIKVLRAGFDVEEVRRRFRSERQILARLEHPHIARLYEGGTTADGRPYLVMEYVDGRPIDRYCDEEQLSIRQRVELIIRVCSAVQFAHRHLVVHRDLKPSNILVDSDGEPRLLDFGIAKLLDPSGFPMTLEATRTGLSPMTPHYASPEQIRGETVTTASDVYGLGVLLYLLLVGRLPYRFPTSSRNDMLDILSGAPPTRPSEALDRPPTPRRPRKSGSDPSGGTAELEVILPEDDEESSQGTEESPPPMSERLGLEPRLARGQMRQGLDNVIMMALRLEPERRYPSIDLLADDLRAWLEGRPVRAHESTFGYRAFSFLRRHRVGVGLVTAILLLLTTASIVTAWQSSVVRKERNAAIEARDQAVLARAETEEVASFLIELFQVSDPAKARGESVTARELLDRGAEKVRAKLSDQPLTQARMMSTIASVYLKLSLYDEAIELLEQSVALRESTPSGEDAVANAHDLVNIARANILSSRLEEADKAIDKATEIYARTGSRDADLAAALNSRATAEYARGDFEQAIEIFQRSIEIWESLPDPDTMSYTNALNNLALTQEALGRVEAAENIHRQVLVIRRDGLGASHPGIADTLNNLGALLADSGRIDEALELYTEALEIRRTVLDRGDVRIGETLGNIAEVRALRGEYRQALGLMEESLQIFQNTFDGPHPYVSLGLMNLGIVQQQLGEYAIAQDYFDRSLEIAQASLPPTHPVVGSVLLQRSAILADRGELEEAEVALENATKIYVASFGEGDPQLATVRASACSIRLAQDRLDEARASCERSVELLTEGRRTDQPDAIEAWALLAEIHRRSGDLDQARIHLDRAQDMADRHWSATHPKRAPLLLTAGDLHQARGKQPQARDAYSRAFEVLKNQDVDPGHLDYRRAQQRLASMTGDSASG